MIYTKLINNYFIFVIITRNPKLSLDKVSEIKKKSTNTNKQIQSSEVFAIGFW